MFHSNKIQRLGVGDSLAAFDFLGVTLEILQRGF